MRSVITRLLGNGHPRALAHATTRLLLIAGASVVIACGGDGDGRARGTLAPRVAVDGAHPAPDVSGSTDGAARVVSRAGIEGVIALTGDHAAAEGRADELMTADCGARGHTVTQEGMEVIYPGPGATEMEWHLHYKCGT